MLTAYLLSGLRISTIIIVLHCMSLLLTQYCAGDKIEKIEMGGTCCTYGGRERGAQGFGGET